MLPEEACLTIFLKALESVVLEKDLSGTQRGIRPSLELARVRCILAIMAFSSFCRHTYRKQTALLTDTFTGWMLPQV